MSGGETGLMLPPSLLLYEVPSSLPNANLLGSNEAERLLPLLPPAECVGDPLRGGGGGGGGGGTKSSTEYDDDDTCCCCCCC